MVEKTVKIETFKSKTFGKYKENNHFDDSEFISQMEEVRIKEIKLFSEDKYFKGIEVYYSFGTQTVTSGQHCSFTDNNLKETSLLLEDDEYIIDVVVGVMNDIVYIKLSTNKGKLIETPGLDLLMKKELVSAVLGEQLIAFSGGYSSDKGGSLTHINIHFGLLPKSIMEKLGIDKVEQRVPIIISPNASPRLLTHSPQRITTRRRSLVRKLS